jgi:hypothetical protein
VRECEPVGLLRPIVYIDLVGLNIDDARKVFLDGIQSVLNGKRKPTSVVERTFGARTYLVPQGRFSDLVVFFQQAIDGTIFGQMNLRKGKRNYHSYDEHLELLRGKKKRKLK